MSAKRVDMGSRDLISCLPDEILGKILSLLWTNRAACTAVLSKRWRNLLALVDNLDLNDASGNYRYFCDFVDRTLALLSNSPTVKRFSLNCNFQHEDARVDNWIRTVLERGFLELHLKTVDHRIDTEFFTSNTLVKLTICDGFSLDGRLPPGGVFFPALKTLSLVQVEFSDDYTDFTYEDFISGCPVLEELSLHNEGDYDPPDWSGVVSSAPSLKRLTIFHSFPDYREVAYESCLFETPSLVFLDYSSFVAEKYEVDLCSLEEARLNIRSWDDESDQDDDIFGDVTDLLSGISNVKTLHLSYDTLEVFHLCCDTMPMFYNLHTLSFESHKDIGWQVVPLLLNNSPNLETLAIEGLVHQVTNMCGDACPCNIPKRRKKMEEGGCCLSTCQVKILHISGYRGTLRELKQMRYFLANLKCLETVKVGVKVNRRQDSYGNNKYQRITNAVMKLPRVSSNCQIHFF
ncbi:PREDICTED: F-box/LRR-repeat protein At2g29930-like [Camelina sativa]|uniref:F-box/LRR-repeat protein At2g29930-like n=1 Tax=Camelina sativa TaxID=90675 RepID=A0ABM0Z4T1_CAMSA|nr:PREDICTED: F-box/LRR-repeat protein At2g29930-like [Camelina sativa]